MNKILFWVSGSKITGLGHIFRMITLAKKLLFLEKNILIKFVTINDDSIKKILEAENISYEVIPDEFNKDDIKKILLDIAKKNKIEKIIIDDFNIGKEVATFLRFQGLKIVNFFYDKKTFIGANLEINPNISMVEAEELSKDKILQGQNYVLLEDNYVNRNYKLKPKVKKIFISFGGSDVNSNTLLVIDYLNQFYQTRDLEMPILIIIKGPKYSDNNFLLKRLEDSQLHSIIYINHLDLSDIMLSSDLAITSLGGTIYELLSLNVPTIGIIQSNNQKQIGLDLESKGLIKTLGFYNQFEYDFFCDVYQNLLDIENRYNLNENSRNYLDGFGAERCAKEILKL